MSSIFQNPQYAPLEPHFIRVMGTYNRLKSTSKKLAKSISYNDSNSSQGLLPPNLRMTLSNYTWPQGLDKETCQQLDKDEQLIWTDALTKIFLSRQNFLRKSLQDFELQLAKYSSPESLQEIFITDDPQFAENPNPLAFMVQHFLERVALGHTTQMEEDNNSFTSSASATASSSSTAISNTTAIDLTDNVTTRELLSLVKSLTSEIKEIKNSLSAGKTVMKTPPTSIPARDKSPRNMKKRPALSTTTLTQPSSIQPSIMPFNHNPSVQHPFGYHHMPANQYPQYHANPYTGQAIPYPYSAMNGPYHHFSNFSPPPPPPPSHYYAPQTATGNHTASVNHGNTQGSVVRFSTV